MNQHCQLYLISPSQFTLPAFADTLEQAFSGGEVAVFQLRMKDASDEEVMQAGEVLLPICQAHDVAFIVNDHPDIARALGAGGVHLGIDDMSVKQAREIVGKDKVIGVSCYGSKDRAMEAGQAGADYVAFGAFYETQTKEPKGRPTSEILEWWSTYTVLPCVAIGGIKPHNAAPLVKAGADFIAVVTGVWDHPDGPKKAVEEYRSVLGSVEEF